MSKQTQPVAEDSLSDLLEKLAKQLKEKNLMLVTAESCTGGLIAASCTELAGSSQWFDRGYVTYSNQAKADMLGVPIKLIEKHGAVSKQVVEAMAIGAYHKSGKRGRIAVSVSGIAGPDGGTKEKPVGTVFVGICYQGTIRSKLLRLTGTRLEVRSGVVEFVFRELIAL